MFPAIEADRTKKRFSKALSLDWTAGAEAVYVLTFMLTFRKS